MDALTALGMHRRGRGSDKHRDIEKPILVATYNWRDANNPKIVAKGTINLKLDE